MADTIKIKEYRGYNILYNSFTKIFVLTEVGGDTSLRQAKTQDEIEKMADVMISAIKKLNPPLSVIIEDWGKLLLGKMTSYDPETKEAWVTTQKGRGKHRIQSVYQDNAQNRDILATISKNRQEVARLQGENNKLEDGLSPITPEIIS